MELQRRSIERRDFSTARRGYDPAEVEAHLAEIANAVEELRGQSAAGGAAQRVQAIVEAAERSAAEIETDAQSQAEQRREQAAEIRTAAEEQAERTRARAQEQADATRQRVATDRAEGLERAAEAERLLEEAGGELERLRSALAKLRGTLEQPIDEVEPEPELEPGAEETEVDAEPEAVEGESLEAEPEAEAEATTVHAELPEADDPVEETQESPAEAAYEAVQDLPKGKRDGAEGARLIALNMALTGTPREETQRYLAENFELDDVDALLDEVYSG